MNRCKIKLNGMEMKVLAMSVANAGVASGSVTNLQELMRMESLERLWSRLRNMYRPNKEKFTVQLSASEAETLLHVVIPYAVNNCDGYVMSFCSRIEEQLRNQVNGVINIYNSMGYGR